MKKRGKRRSPAARRPSAPGAAVEGDSAKAAAAAQEGSRERVIETSRQNEDVERPVMPQPNEDLQQPPRREEGARVPTNGAEV